MAFHKASLVAAAAMALAVLPAQSAFAADGLALIKKSDCTICHTFKDSEPKKLGPSYQAVAKKYKGDKKVAPTLADKVIKGGSGVWGPVAMTPHPQLAKADVVAMVTWILSQK